MTLKITCAVLSTLLMVTVSFGQSVNYKNSTLIVDEILGRAVGDPHFPPGHLVHYDKDGKDDFECDNGKGNWPE